MSFHGTLFTYEKKKLGVARKFRGWKGLLDVSYVYVPPFLPPSYYLMLMQWFKKYDVFDFEESATTLSSSSWIDLPMRQKIIKKNRRNLPSCTSLVDPRLTLTLTHEFEIFHENFFWRVKAHILKGKNFISNCVSLFR